jgi:sugar phosphate isomerase/epimerase
MPQQPFASMSRRNWIGSAVAASAVRDRLRAARRIPVALELFSLRQDAAKDLPGTLAAIARMGYEGIELVGEKGGLQNTSPFGRSAQEIRRMLDDLNLKVFSAHHTMTLLRDEALERTVEFNRALGNSRVICAWLDPTKTIQPWYDHARRFNEIAQKLKAHQMQLGFHNHAHELEPVEGKLPWDVFCDNTGRDVILQLHVAAFPARGLPVTDYIRRCPGRITSLHLNDYAPGRRGVLLGEGTVDWKAVIETAESVGGLELYIVEQEGYPEGMSPMEACRRCLENFRRLRG